MRHLIGWTAIGIGIFIISTLAGANNVCLDAEKSTEDIAEALTSSLSGTTANGEFQVKQIDDKNNVSMMFEITYVIDGKVSAFNTIRRSTSESKDQEYGFWSGYSILEIKVEHNQLKLKWDTGGSRCCTCAYTIMPVLRGFRALIPRY